MKLKSPRSVLADDWHAVEPQILFLKQTIKFHPIKPGGGGVLNQPPSGFSSVDLYLVLLQC